jgi:hypothetical protein
MGGTNKTVLALLLGRRFGPFAGAVVHVDDVARAHVAAIDQRVYGGESYILSRAARWDDAIAVAKAAWPEAFAKRVFVESGSVGTTPLPMDTRTTDTTFRFELMGYDDMVRSVVGQFAELRMRKSVGGGSACGTGAATQAAKSRVRPIR